LAGARPIAAAVSDLVRTIDGPVVLVAHSYGGAVITNVAADAGEIVGLVYVAGFAPEPGESAFTLAGMFPGSTLGEAVNPVPRSDGTTDLYLDTDRFHSQFCADVPAEQAARMAATQRPATQEALFEPSGERPLWRDLPSWFVFGELDRNIPAELEHYGQAGPRPPHHRDPRRLARRPRRAPRRDRAPDPRGGVAAHRRLTARCYPQSARTVDRGRGTEAPARSRSSCATFTPGPTSTSSAVPRHSARVVAA
jgi:hypothetical protein